MNKNIFAYTELQYNSYPGYISVNKRDGKYFITVRSKDASNGSEIEIPFRELTELLTKLGRAIMDEFSLEGED